MGFRAEEKSLKIRSTGNLARAHFAQTAKRSQYLVQTGNVGGKKSSSFKALINPLEYIANTTHIVSALTYGAEPTAEKSNGVCTAAPPSHNAGRSSLDYSKINNISKFKNFRGYLQPMTLEEYCTLKSYTQTAAKLFQQ